MQLIVTPLVIIALLPIVFFFNAPAPTEIYTLSLHDALPISESALGIVFDKAILKNGQEIPLNVAIQALASAQRSEEHTSELQSHSDLVCRLLLEKKKNTP